VIVVVVATLDPLAVPDAAIAVVAVAAGVCAPPMLGVAVVGVGSAFRRGGGVGGVNCRSIPS